MIRHILKTMPFHLEGIRRALGGLPEFDSVQCCQRSIPANRATYVILLLQDSERSHPVLPGDKGLVLHRRG
jgi:hypothetical protein